MKRPKQSDQKWDNLWKLQGSTSLVPCSVSEDKKTNFCWERLSKSPTRNALQGINSRKRSIRMSRLSKKNKWTPQTQKKCFSEMNTSTRVRCNSQCHPLCHPALLRRMKWQLSLKECLPSQTTRSELQGYVTKRLLIERLNDTTLSRGLTKSVLSKKSKSKQSGALTCLNQNKGGLFAHTFFQC